MKKSKLTGREVIMVVFLVVLLVGVCYYLLFLTPLKKDIADINNQISEAESQLSVSQAQVASMDKMQAELDEILSRPKDEITEIAPYDNAKQLMRHLNGIHMVVIKSFSYFYCYWFFYCFYCFFYYFSG